MSEYTHIINGKPVTSSKKLDVINPATQEKIAELDEAVAAARAAFPGWAAKSVDERAEVLNQIASVIEKNLEEYKNMLTAEQGKPLSNAQLEIGFAPVWIRQTAALRLSENVTTDNEEQKVIERYVPLGVCAGIVPWNFPLLICIVKLGPALLAGNTIIIKPSPFTPLTTLRFIKDIQHLVPPGVVNVLSGNDDLGPMITAHPNIDKISFTGSSFTGKKVMQSSSVGLKRVTLELGGNDPMILLPDVDPKKVAPEIFWGTFANNGQACVAAKRLYVHEKIYDEFRNAFVEFSKTIKVGNGMDPDSQLGPIQNITQFQKVASYFEDAHANGYKFALGGNLDPNPTKGLFVPISILDNPPEDSKIVREEPFGPIVPLLKWSDEKDVVERANNTNLGLAASVWGEDVQAVERIAKQIQAGTVSMNEFIPFSPLNAFGGHKESGIGVEGGIHGLKAYSNLQTLTLKKKPAFAKGGN
ncbi:hypothetical protein FS749_000994 [Ceratobasidium sp. UAMH 11750]|nr:hypothetical protein FS749_000994 [Ceratobasidium sp. UAMH 11750]